MRKRGIFLFLFCLFLACPVRAEEPLRSPRERLYSAPVYSRDGVVMIKARAAQMSLRAPVLVFVERVREELGRATQLKFAPENGILEVLIGDRQDGATDVRLSRTIDVHGGDCETIFLPDAKSSDLHELRRCICVALLRLWVFDAAFAAGTKPAEIPMWLVNGVIRYLDRSSRQTDVDRALLLWSRACLPPAHDLFAMESRAAMSEPAVASLLASWFMEKRNNLLPLELVLRHAAKGNPWTPQSVAKILGGTDDLFAFDRQIDRRMLAEKRVVKQPGITTPGIVRRFRDKLFLYPRFFENTNGRGYSPRQIIERFEDPEVKTLALRQADLIRVTTLGRDLMFTEMAGAYETFFRAFAKKNVKPGELTRLLMAAEDLRSVLESRAENGEIMGNTGGSLEGAKSFFCMGHEATQTTCRRCRSL